MIRLRLLCVSFAALGFALVPAGCSKKSDSGGGGSGAKEEKDDDDDGGDEDDSSDAPIAESDTADPCLRLDGDEGEAEGEEEGEAEGEDEEGEATSAGEDEAGSASSNDPCGGGDDGEKHEPDADFFVDFFEPPKLKQCHDAGFLYLRCKDDCSVVKHPAAFQCDKAGIEAVFKNVQGFKEDFDKYLGQGYFIDQCGATPNGKPFVAMACFTKGDGVCVAKEDVDSNEATVEAHQLTTDQDPAITSQCQ